MKNIRTFIIGMMMLIGTSAFAQPMNYNAIRNNARFLTDRMAYTLGITSMDIIDDIYRINYDYIYGVNNYLDDIALGYRYDDYLAMCAERDYALRMLLGDVIWGRLIGFDYFYRPIIFENHRWRFGIYAYDYNRSFFHFGIPHHFHEYRGGHFFGGMHHSHGIGTRGPGMTHIESRGGIMHGNRSGNMGPGMNNGIRPGGNMNPGNRTNGNMNHGGQPGGNVTPNVQPGDNNNRGEMNRGGQAGGEMNRGGVSRGGSVRTDNNRTSTSRSTYPSRSESNVRSSSRTSSYGTSAGSRGTVSTPSRSGSFGGSSSGASRGSFGGSSASGSRGGSIGGGASRGGSAAGSHGRR